MIAGQTIRKSKKQPSDLVCKGSQLLLDSNWQGFKKTDGLPAKATGVPLEPKPE